jgi:uncharacterized Tic20 family protein
MSIADELQKLQRMHESGSLSDEEFARAKEALMNAPPPPVAQATAAGSEPVRVDQEQQTRQWAMFVHLSLLSGFVVPFAGLVVPIVLWQVKKGELPGIDAHGKVVTNWIISSIIYAVVCIPLMLVFIGIPLLIALGILGIIFPILGGIKANNGELWKYPLSISFLK